MMGLYIKPNLRIFLLAALLLLSSAAIQARADGILIPPDEFNINAAFAIRYHNVTVDIADGVVRTSVDQEFENLTGRRIQADYIFPIPQGAVLDDFAMWVGDKKLTAEVLPAAEARKIYEDIVRRQMDPALLEYIGNNAFRARVFPIEPGERKRIKLSYSQVLTADNGIYEYIYPLNTEKFSARPLDTVSVTGTISMGMPIKTIYSPSHSISVNRKSDKSATFSYEQANVKPAVDFVLYYSVDAREIGASLLAYKEDNADDGFFLATITPRVEGAKDKVVNKNFLFVLDKSGSMEDDKKIEQAKDALKFVLRNLHEGDRFNVIAYSESLWECFPDGMKTYGSDTRDKALQFVGQFSAEGSTDIHQALTRALGMLDKEGGNKPSYVVFLTDGLPTAGETNEDTILKDVTAANKLRTRLFAFGVGYDVNTHLLDKLTEANHGLTEYVRPSESIEGKVSGLYAKISSPVLSDVKLDIAGATVRDFYPTEMPDLFRGEQIVIVGRYASGAKNGTINLRGKVEGKDKSFSFPVSFTSKAAHKFVPRIWAGRKIGFLTDEIRLHGVNDELINEVIRLSKRYGIITEYTSFLILEDNNYFAPAEAQASMMRDNSLTLNEAKAGAGGVGQAQNSQQLKGQNAGSGQAAMAPQGYYDAEGNQQQVTNIQYQDDLTFVLQDGFWTDSRYDPKVQKLQEVKAFSDEYFKLLDGNPGLGQYFAMGNQVIVVLDDDNAIKVISEEKTESAG
jgi:Ca-activated chloride channel family protein